MKTLKLNWEKITPGIASLIVIGFTALAIIAVVKNWPVIYHTLVSR